MEGNLILYIIFFILFLNKSNQSISLPIKFPNTLTLFDDPIIFIGHDRIKFYDSRMISEDTFKPFI